MHTSAAEAAAGARDVSVRVCLAAPRTGPGCLQIDEILAHVAQCESGRHAADRLRLLLEAAEACARLLAARRGLTQAFDVQSHLHRLANLAQGRAQAQGLDTAQADPLQAPLSLAQARATAALAEWRAAGQAFSRLTGLLSTQLPHGVEWPAAQQALHEAGAPGGQACAQAWPQRDLMDHTLTRYAAAHRRCEAALTAAVGTQAVRLKSASEWRMGRGSLLSVARAWLADQDVQAVLLQAQADRAGAHWAWGVLIRAQAAWFRRG